jgi:hypothetical protein
MAPNKRGGPLSASAVQQELAESSVIAAQDIASRGTGTKETDDSYSSDRRLQCEARVFFTG